MDVGLIFEYAKIVLRELWNHKFKALFLFSIVSFLVLVLGLFRSSSFETSATIFADNQNILKPLLSNQAAQSNVQDATRVVKDMILSPSLLTDVVVELHKGELLSPIQIGEYIRVLRARLSVSGLGSSYIKVSYSDETSEAAYVTLNEVIDQFINTSVQKQRSESREAFVFINNQVEQYKDQLVSAEERLKQFRSENFDGRSSDVDTSIATLRSQIENLKISIEEDQTKLKELGKQLASESQFASRQYKEDVYAERLRDLESRLSVLLLSYTEDYPDVVSLRYQIDDVKNTIRENASRETADTASDDTESVINPIYQELRSRESQIVTDMQAKQKRIVALERLLQEEFERRGRIAERSAEEAELTRDYNVTKKIYEDMLERKEKARLSMTLNIEGQGVTYRVQEPVTLPLKPKGLRFVHFVLAGPFLGVAAVIGCFIVFVFLDPRVRRDEDLASIDADIVAVVPHVYSPISKAILRKDIVLMVFLFLLLIGGYLSLAFASKLGVLTL